jgi:CheY-like chemotaxis protein
LLVDDNLINLTLLRTYMRKRAYDTVDEAENGLAAVNRFTERADGYDIIFMDISMPILDGFGASRQIRAVEASRRNAAAAEEADALGKSRLEKPTRGEKLGNDISDEEAEKKKTKKKIPEPALIIALTGLASTQDQSEALSSGIDLFMTKPVAFREVGKLLDNWEANR